MPLPRISIVTPCYNAENYLEETIDSVLAQNYPNIQYIIVDGGSQDRSPEIIKKYERYLDYWISEPDQGQSDAICKGLRRCDGDVFNWLNADDKYKKDALHTIGLYFSEPDINVFAGKSRIYGMGPDRISPGTDIYSNNLEKTIGRARIDQPETFFRLSQIRAIGGPNKCFHFTMDKELWIRYLVTYGLRGIYSSTEVLVDFRHHSNSKTISQPKGFEEEDKLLSSFVLGMESSAINRIRSRANLKSWPSIKLRAVKAEWSLHHYEIAYAKRDWIAMDNWKQCVQQYCLGFPSRARIANLEFRRRILNQIISHL